MSPAQQKIWNFSKRLMLGTGGQIGVSAANFILSLVLLSHIKPESFGTFAFIQILVFFSFSASNAMLSSPLMAELHRNNKQEKETVLSFFHVNFVIGLLISLAIFLICSFSLGQPPLTGTLFAISSFLLFVGRLYRTYLLDHEKAARVLISDYTYSVILILGSIAVYLLNTVSIEIAVGILSLSALLSCIIMGREILALQWSGLISGQWAGFIEGFKHHGHHALTGVLTTEATGRAHSYIVTLWLGPAAFAPLAAAALFFRPVHLVILSLTQFERARLARLLRDNANKEAWHELRFFYISLGAVWVFNIALIWIVMQFFYDSLLGGKYAYHDITYAIALYAFITVVTCIRGPASALLQANADFKSLSLTTVVSSIVTVPIVLLCVYQFGAIWSLVGVFVGELVAAVLIFKLARTRIPKS